MLEDAERFAGGLHRTQAGFALRLAIHEGRVAVQQITRLSRLGGVRRAYAIDTWRRAYIKACNRASTAIDELWDAHQWPSDGARNRSYEWKARLR